MYSLVANPESLALLTFSIIDNIFKIRFWDTLTASQVEINLNDKLVRDIMLFKTGEFNIIKINKTQIIKDRSNALIKSDYIITITSSEIYKIE